MINVQVLSDNPQLNDYAVETSQQYAPGETVTINFQLLNIDAAIRYIPPSAALVNVTFTQSDGTPLIIPATAVFPADDRSIWKVVLTAVQSPIIIGNNFLVTVDTAGDGSNLVIGIANNSLTKVFFDGDC